MLFIHSVYKENSQEDYALQYVVFLFENYILGVEYMSIPDVFCQ